MTEQEKKPKILDLNSLVPIGVLIAAVLGLSGWAVWLSGQFLRIDFRLTSIEKTISEKLSDPWNMDRMQGWAELLKKGNPTLDVPPVRRGG